MKLIINQQRSSDNVWKDEAGTKIPYNRINPYERKAESKLAQIAKAAVNVNERLSNFKADLQKAASELYAAFIAQNGGKAPGRGKGNLTFYNFDRSIKVEMSVNESISFDENTIQLAHDKLNELLEDGLEEAKDFVKPLVMDAFSTAKGKLDTKRVLGLRRYADKISDPRYAEAMSFIDQAIRKPSSKEYFRVWIRGNNGEYHDVQLNFSAI